MLCVYVHYFNDTVYKRCRETSNSLWTLYNEICSEHPTAAPAPTASVTLVRSVRWSSNVPLRWQQCETGGRNTSGSKRKPRKWVCGFQLPLLTWTFEPHLTPKADWVKWLQGASVDRRCSFCSFLWSEPNASCFSPPIRKGKVRVRKAPQHCFRVLRVC